MDHSEYLNWKTLENKVKYVDEKYLKAVAEKFSKIPIEVADTKFSVTDLFTVELRHVDKDTRYRVTAYSGPNFFYVQPIMSDGTLNGGIIVDFGRLFYEGEDFNKEINIIDNVLPDIHPNTVLITHWHEDHFSLGFFFNNDAHWIGMEDSPSGTKLDELLINYLKQNNQISIITDEYDGKKVVEVNGCIVLWKGKGVDDDDSVMNPPVKAHANGLILQVKNKDHNMVFPGDCPYQFWPDELINEADTITHLVAPHHGSDINADLSIVLEKTGPLAEVAIISNPVSVDINDGQHYQKLQEKFPCVRLVGFEDNPDYTFEI